jgi:hypothetical protein
MKQHAAQRTRFQDAAIICDAPPQRLLRSASRSVADPQRKCENRPPPRWETESVAKFQPDSLHTVTPRIVARNPEILVRFLQQVFEAKGEFRSGVPVIRLPPPEVGFWPVPPNSSPTIERGRDVRGPL